MAEAAAHASTSVHDPLSSFSIHSSVRIQHLGGSTPTCSFRSPSRAGELLTVHLTTCTSSFLRTGQNICFSFLDRGISFLWMSVQSRILPVVSRPPEPIALTKSIRFRWRVRVKTSVVASVALWRGRCRLILNDPKINRSKTIYFIFYYYASEVASLPLQFHSWIGETTL